MPRPKPNRYRPPSRPPVSAWARHLDAYQREHGLSQTGLFKLVRDALGYGPDSRTAFRPYLVAKEPDEQDARKLAAIVGWPPAETEPQPDPLIGKAPDLAAALVMLTTELGAWRQEREALVARVADLEATVAGLVPATPSAVENGAHEGPAAPRDSMA